VIGIDRAVVRADRARDARRTCALGPFGHQLGLPLVQTRDRRAETVGGEHFVRAQTPVCGSFTNLNRLVLVRAHVPPAAGVSARTGAAPEQRQTLAERRHILDVVPWITRPEETLDRCESRVTLPLRSVRVIELVIVVVNDRRECVAIARGECRREAGLRRGRRVRPHTAAHR
jgi:hypothetical protein